MVALSFALALIESKDADSGGHTKVGARLAFVVWAYVVTDLDKNWYTMKGASQFAVCVFSIELGSPIQHEVFGLNRYEGFELQGTFIASVDLDQ